MNTTLNKIRKHNPCKQGWTKLLKHSGKTFADDEPLSIIAILESNGLDDALWCLRAVDGYDREMRLYAVWCVRQVQHLLTDKRSLDALDVAERYANGQATAQELKVARAAAGAAGAADAADAADAAGAAGAAWAAGDAWDAARAAADCARAARAADAADAARTARAAAWDAAGAAQEKQLRKVCAKCEVAV